MRVKSFPLFISVVKKYLAIKIVGENSIFYDERKVEGELLLIKLSPRISDMLILTKNIYQLPVSINLILKGYDVLGSEVATLVNEEQPAGKYEMEFDANGLSNGIYLYRIISGSFIDTRKMILVR